MVSFVVTTHSMTDKKEKILTSALELFANFGYNAVATSKIAREAGVSEGLIFRHFNSKQGLLDAILKQAFERAATSYAPIIIEQDPKKVLSMAIQLLFVADQEKYHFWKLQFKLKWELEISGKEKTKPLVDKLAWAFAELGYGQPEKEAEILWHILESMLSGIVRDGIDTQIHLREFLLHKYHV